MKFIFILIQKDLPYFDTDIVQTLVKCDQDYFFFQN